MKLKNYPSEDEKFSSWYREVYPEDAAKIDAGIPSITIVALLEKRAELLHALKIAAEALEEWHDESTLPYILGIIKESEEK